MHKETKVVNTAETKYRIIGLSYTKPRYYTLQSGEVVFARYTVSINEGLADETLFRVEKIEYDTMLKAFKIHYLKGTAKDSRPRLRVIPHNPEIEIYYEEI